MVNTNVEVSKKVSYNPLKMWGSWIGAVPGLFYTFFGVLFLLGFSGPTIFTFHGSSTFLLIMLFNFLPYIIIGFLLGWSIHSLVRYLKNKK
ncbi:MAG: hypothetical protein ABIJ58_01140 [Nanoarchaeota archaeon]